MIETILIARDRKTGKDVLLAGREVPFKKQVELYKNLGSVTHEEFSGASLAHVQPHKKPLKFITKAEKEARDKSHAEAVAKAESEAKSSAEKQSPAKKNEAVKTETKTK